MSLLQHLIDVDGGLAIAELDEGANLAVARRQLTGIKTSLG